MAYADLLQSEGINQQYLAVLKPRRKNVDSWTLHAGSVYKQGFDFGEIVAVLVDGAALAPGTSATLSAGQFYFDVDAEILYVRTSGSADPTGMFVVSTFELYMGTFDAHWHKTPTDTASRQVYFEPMIARSPTISQSVSEGLFGFLPVATGSITLSNVTHLFEKYVYDSSFSQAEIRIFHWLGDLDAANIKEVFRGVCGSLNSSDRQVKIKLYSRQDLFKTEYRNAGAAESFYDATLFSGLNPNFNGRPIRRVYGLVDGFVPVNVDYVSENPTTSDNRDWAVMSGQSSLHTITRTVAASPASTATRTYLNSAVGFSVGDTAFFDRAVGVDEYPIVTLVNYGSNYIEHAALTGGAMASGDSVSRGFVAFVEIVQQGVSYKARYVRDYALNNSMAGGSVGFSFVAGLEANLGLPATLSPNDKVHCRVYGKTNDVTLGGPAFGTNDAELGNLTDPAVVLFDILKTNLGLAESEINTSSFQSWQTVSTDAVGFAIPRASTNQFPTHKDIALWFSQSSLVRIYIDNDGKWKVSLLAPLAASVKTITDDEILNGQFSYAFSYDDILSDVIVEYASREVASDLEGQGGQVRTASTHSDNAEFVHGIKKQKTFSSLHFRDADAQTLADHLSYVFGDRAGILSLASKGRFYETVISDVIEVSRDALPGFEFEQGTLRALDFSVVEVSRGLKETEIVMDDQKGIEENSGTW